MCSDAGADAAKFQHFRADHIVSDKGFTDLGRNYHINSMEKISI